MAMALARHYGWEGAVKALDSLLERFVDWNEIRISYVREIAEPFVEAGLPDPKARAREVKEFLEEIFRTRNQATLAYLERMEPEEAFEDLRNRPLAG